MSLLPFPKRYIPPWMYIITGKTLSDCAFGVNTLRKRQSSDPARLLEKTSFWKDMFLKLSSLTTYSFENFDIQPFFSAI